jgi:hypothetical protein
LKSFEISRVFSENLVKTGEIMAEIPVKVLIKLHSHRAICNIIDGDNRGSSVDVGFNGDKSIYEGEEIKGDVIWYTSNPNMHEFSGKITRY